MTKDDEDSLHICGAGCNGSKVTASDPLAQYVCPYTRIHVNGEHIRNAYRECYRPRVIDQVVASEVKKLPGSKVYNQMWGHDDDPEEWQET